MREIFFAGRKREGSEAGGAGEDVGAGGPSPSTYISCNITCGRGRLCNSMLVAHINLNISR